ncbi:MAG TPA: trypsin-like peptidase domain-containing protein [Ktedonobacterales bacterium]
MQGETDETTSDVAQAPIPEGQQDEAATDSNVTAPLADEPLTAEAEADPPESAAPAETGEAAETPAPSSPPTSAPVAAPSAAPAASGNSRSLMENRLWIILGILALVSLLFALLAAAANGNGATGADVGGGSLASAQQETVALIQNVNPSVVQIQARSILTGGIGSGEIATTSGYIVTNSHVVHGFRDLTVLLSDNRTFPAQLVGDVPEEDLAVLKINAPNLKPIAFGDSSKVQVGDFALALGSPLGLEQSATTGIVSALNRSARVVTNGQLVTLRGMIQTSAPINPGNSGGALVNAQGELIGIPTLGAVDPTSGAAANGIGFAITSNHARAVLARFER